MWTILALVLSKTRSEALTTAILHHHPLRLRHQHHQGLLQALVVEYQADFQRGSQHLSAFLNEGDMVAYQTGSWTVDGVTVGRSDTPTTIRWCHVDHVQIVWTHNCEHGVIRGWDYYQQPQNRDDCYHLRRDTTEMVEFGPEQLLARVPVEWIDDQTCRLVVDKDERQWTTILG